MNLRIFIWSLIVLCTGSLLYSQKGNPNRGSSPDEEEYLFPGTGFFIKNRKPYDENEANPGLGKHTILTSRTKAVSH